MLVSLIRLPFTLGRIVFWAGLWLFGLSLWLWYPLRWRPGDDLLPVQLLNYFMPWLLVGLLPGLIMAAVARRVRLALVLAVPTLVIAASYAPLFLPRPRPALASNSSIKVMSYNIWAFNRDIEAAATVIGQQQPDILLLQEISPRVVHELESRLADLYPGQELHVAFEPGKYQAVVSRYPFTPVTDAFGGAQTQAVQVETPAGSVQIWNVHLSRPLYWYRHYVQVKRLAHAAAAVDGPLIVGGDFNTTDQSEMYHYLNQYLSNAHWEAGWGFGFSFPSENRRIKRTISIPVPMIRIDHLFHNDYLFAQKAKTISESGGSDHLPVMAEFLFTREVER